MNRAEFMRQLESLLQTISATEREEALQYYNDYFDDAGKDNEQAVIEALGTPARVAENIKRDILENTGGDISGRASASDRAMIEYGKTDAVFGEADREQSAETAAEWDKEEDWQTAKTGEENRKAARNILLVILGIFAIPVILPLAIGILGVLFGLLMAWFGFVFAFGMVALALLITLVVLLVVGIMSMAVDPFAGIALLGSGMVCGGVGFLFLMLTGVLAGGVTPVIMRGVSKLFRFGRKA